MTEPISRLREALADRYRIERELGRGGMATVYLASDLRHKRQVALKVLDAHVASVVGPARFLREIETAAQLQHPHILPVFDSGNTAEQLWYTMPYVAGESLRDRLRREGQLEVAEAIRLAREIAEALEAAHRADVIHRDIKPENVLLSHGKALVADFGIARSGHQATDEALTATGLSLGTPAYMSPEQALGERALDGRADIYSLGCLTYELLTGVTPFPASSARAIVAAHIANPVPDVRKARPEIPSSVANAISRALAKAPEERFGTAADFAEALTGTPASSSNRASTIITRPKVIAMVVAVVVAVGATVWGFANRRTADGPTRLAVLPFENLGDTADTYFAKGLAGELRGRLAAVPGLEVIGSASSNSFDSSKVSPRQVASALGVQYVLVGQVQWDRRAASGGRLRVHPELVDGHTGATSWGQAFDASAADVFRVQAEIASEVTSALGIALGKEARASLTARPAASEQAYDAYLRAKTALEEYSNVGASADIPRILQYARQAVGEDSASGPIRALLSRAYTLAAPFGCRRCAMGDSARYAAETAIRLAPARPEGYRALSSYYGGIADDPRKALDAVESGLRRSPNDAELLGNSAWLLGILGEWDRALAAAEAANKVDPRSLDGLRAHARLLVYLHRYDDLRALCQRGLALAPRYSHFVAWKMIASLMQGDSLGARAAFSEGSPALDLSTLTSALANLFQDLLPWVMTPAAQTLFTTQPAPADPTDRISWWAARASLASWRNDASHARVYSDSAVAAFDAAFPAKDRDATLHVWRAQLLGYAQRAPEAKEELKLEQATAGHPDAFFDPVRDQERALTLIQLGESDKAIDILTDLVNKPCWLTKDWLRIAPEYRPLRGNPRFQALVTGAYQSVGR